MVKKVDNVNLKRNFKTENFGGNYTVELNFDYGSNWFKFCLKLYFFFAYSVCLVESVNKSVTHT